LIEANVLPLSQTTNHIHKP